MNIAVLRWRNRPAAAAATLAVVMMVVASLSPSSPAFAAEPGVGDSVYVAKKMEGYGGSAMVGIFASTPPDIGNLGTPDYWGYCVEHDVPLGTFRTAMVEAPPSYLGSNYFIDPAIQGKVLWVLAHSYPYLSLSDFGNASGVPGISASDAIEAAQYAIWRYTDLTFDAAWNWTTPNSETAYWHLLSGANASGGMTPAQLQTTATIAAPGGTPAAGTLVGPFTISTNQSIASVSVTGGYTLTDASGTAIDTSAVTNGQDIYIDLTGVTAAGSATVTVAAAGSSVSGNIISVPAIAGGTATTDSHAQTLVIVAPSTSRVTDSTTVSWATNVTLTKTLSGESGSIAGQAEAGEQLTYTITVTNSAGAPALNYGVTDTLDPNVTFVSATHSGAAAGGVVTWSGLTVPANGSLTLTVVVQVVDPIPAGVTQIGNVAYEAGTTPPACPPAGSQCVVVPTAPKVTIVKELAAESGRLPGVAEPGEQLTYAITLTNTGGSAATNYSVTDALDPNTTFMSADNGGTAAAGLVTWNGLTVPANGSLTLTVVVRVVDPLPAGVNHVANVAYQTGTTPPACPPAGGQCVVIPTEGAVVIVKALAAESGRVAGVAEPGEQLTYTITLTNTGGSAVTNYGVEDRLDSNTSFVSADNGGTFAAGVVAWSGLTIPANGALTLAVVVKVADPIPAGVTQIRNVAYQTGTPPPSCPPAGGQCVIVPTAGAVMIAKSVRDASGNGQAEPGEQLTYTITLTNSGGSAVTNVGVSDPLDANTAFVSADNGGTFAAGVVSWSGLTVPANGTLPLTVVVRVVDPVPPGVTQIGNVAYETGTPPPDCKATPRPANCTSIEVPPPAGVPQLLITKVADTATLRPGGTVVYTITLRNVGNVDAIGAVIGDPIPAGIDAFAWTCAASGGVACPNASGSGAIAETIATIPVGAMLVYTVTATLSADPPETVINTATVTPSGIATCTPAGTPPSCRATVIGTVTPAQTPLPVPAVHNWAQLLIALSLFGLAWRSWRRVGR